MIDLLGPLVLIVIGLLLFEHGFTQWVPPERKPAQPAPYTRPARPIVRPVVIRRK